MAYHNSMALPDKKAIGPRRLITEAVKLGEWGQSRWHVVLECGHSLDRVRKPKIGSDKVSCKACLDYSPTAVDTISPDTEIAELPDEFVHICRACFIRGKSILIASGPTIETESSRVAIPSRGSSRSYQIREATC